jgi:hypothetical protein
VKPFQSDFRESSGRERQKFGLGAIPAEHRLSPLPIRRSHGNTDRRKKLCLREASDRDRGSRLLSKMAEFKQLVSWRGR